MAEANPGGTRAPGPFFQRAEPRPVGGLKGGATRERGTPIERRTGGVQAPGGYQKEQYMNRSIRQAAMAKAASKGSARNRAEKAESQQDFRERQQAGQRGKRVQETIKGEKAFGPGVQNFRNPNESYIGRGGP